jgi:hypothetical protein
MVESDNAEVAKRVGQDVATPLRQRRFLDQKSFDALLNEIVRSAPDKDAQEHIRKQFDEGEDIDLQAALERLDKAGRGHPRHEAVEASRTGIRFKASRRRPAPP